MEKLLLRLSPQARVRLGWALIVGAFVYAAAYFALDLPRLAWIPAIILSALGGPILGSERRRRQNKEQRSSLGRRPLTQEDPL